MIDDIRRLLARYQEWLRDKTVLREVGGWIEITSPYLDRNNDYIQIYAKRNSNGFTLTDDGYTIGDLERSGCKLGSVKRQTLLKTTLNGFGVQIENDRLEVSASPENFSLRKHNLIQAMLAVNDLFYLAEPMVASLFLEDVAGWLDLNDIRYTPNVKFTGKSGYDHHFDFVIPRSRRQPERILRAINRPSRDAAQSVAFSWIDTKEIRPADSKAFAFLNDSDREIQSGVFDALRNYSLTPILWSQREAVKDALIS